VDRGPLPAWSEPQLQTWRRRAVSVPGLYLLTALYLALLPALLLLALLHDVVTRARLAYVRGLLALAVNLVVHCVGLVALFVVWLFSGRWLRRSERPQLRASYLVEVWLSRAIVAGIERVYGIRRVVEGLDALGDGPTLLLARHVSLVDPVLFLAVLGHAGSTLRYVCKRELLWDPCIDVLGHRVPMAFVWRGMSRHEADVENVSHLVDALGDDDVVLVFPEGTRFTERKQRRALLRLASHRPALAEIASRWRHVLPPHPSGALALLEREPSLNVVVCAHTGLEGARALRDLIDGALIGREVRIGLWRVPREEIPNDREARAAWLFDVMGDMEDWVGQHRSGPGAGPDDPG
jgi:1-acyl-sn-glycerol-3-phosphate acyltransferase